jgi:E3 ubiquitin-protein ligase CHFR
MDASPAAAKVPTGAAVAAWLGESALTPSAPPPVVPAALGDRAQTAMDMFDLAAAPVKPVVARFVSADGSSKGLEFLQGEPVARIGRSKELPLSNRLDSNRLSSLHCEIRLETATNVVMIVDTSTNGVWVNGARLDKGKPTELHAGDTIRLLNPDVKVPEGTPSFEYLFQQLKPKTTATALIDDLSCSICRTVYYRPVTVIPCLHSFCGHCVSAWLKTGSKDCPECRTKMREVRPSHKLTSLVDELVKTRPEHGKSAEDRKLYDAENTIPMLGLAVSKRERDASGHGGDGGSGDDSGDGYGDEDSTGDDSDGSGSYHGGGGGGFGFAAFAPAPVPYKLPMFFAAPPTHCVQCATPSALDGFQCPPHGPHLSCFLCRTAFPHRPLGPIPQQCDLCNKAFCDLYLGGCKNPAGVGYFQPITDHEMRELPLGSLFIGNTIEQGILIQYLATAKIDVATVWALCQEKLKSGEWVPDITSVKGPIKQSTVCRPCALRIFASLLYHFRRAIPRDSMSPEVGSRPDCWYGLQCRTMKSSVVHAQKYNHVCPNMKRKE